MLIHENVGGFDTSMLEEMLGELYELVVLAVKPKHAAFPMVARPRSYSVLFLRGQVEHIASVSTLYDQVKQALGGFVPKPPVSSLFILGDSCCLVEENRLRRLKDLPVLAKPSGDWSYLLTEKQRGFLSGYLSLCPPTLHSGEIVFDLSQSPRFRCRCSSQGVLPTITRKSVRLWMPSRARWLLPIELAHAQGFVVTPSSAEDAMVPMDVESYTFGQVGNSMHMASVGSVMAIALASVRRVG